MQYIPFAASKIDQCSSNAKEATWTVELSSPSDEIGSECCLNTKGYPGTAALSIPWCSRTIKDKYA